MLKIFIAKTRRLIFFTSALYLWLFSAKSRCFSDRGIFMPAPISVDLRQAPAVILETMSRRHGNEKPSTSLSLCLPPLSSQCSCCLSWKAPLVQSSSFTANLERKKNTWRRSGLQSPSVGRSFHLSCSCRCCLFMSLFSTLIARTVVTFFFLTEREEK